MSSLRHENTQYGLGNGQTGDAFKNVNTISAGVCSKEQDTGSTDHHDRDVHEAHRRLSLPHIVHYHRRFTNDGHCATCGLQQPSPTDVQLRKLLLLGVAFILYVSVGAVIFTTLESGPEHHRKHTLEGYIDDFLLLHRCINRSSVIELMNKAVEDSEIVYYVAQNKKDLDRWAFSGAFGFVVSVVTTIGFGNLSPHTQAGKVVCVFYALFGIPLTLLVLRAIGQKMAYSYVRIRKFRCSLCHGSPKMNRRLNVLFITVIGFAVLFVLPAMIFSYVESWHFLEALYFCFTTLSTVGFGDYVIGIHEEQLSSTLAHNIYIVAGYIWILMGLSFLSLVYRIIMDTAIASARTVGQKTKEKLGNENHRRIPGHNESPRRVMDSPHRQHRRDGEAPTTSAHLENRRSPSPSRRH